LIGQNKSKFVNYKDKILNLGQNIGCPIHQVLMVASEMVLLCVLLLLHSRSKGKSSQ